MDQTFASAWDQLVGRIDGPFHLRLILQPVMATIFGIRAGMKDARAHNAPYLWRVFNDRDARPRLIREGFKDARNVFVLALILDVIYQYMQFRWIYPVQLLLVPIVLALIPYAVVRGLVDRIMR